MNRICSPQVVLALAMVGCFGFGQASESGTLDFETSDLMFSIDGGASLGIFPIAIEEGASEAVSYYLEPGSIHFVVATSTLGRYGAPLFCFDYSDNNGAAVRLNVDDANGHVIINGLAPGFSLQYILSNSEFRMVAGSRAQCFHKDTVTGNFGLFGMLPSSGVADDNGDRFFIDKFEAVPGVNVEYLNVPQFVHDGQFLNYQLRITNTGNSSLSGLSFQEVFPRNAAVFDATLSSGSWGCSAAGGATCPGGGNNDGPLRFEQVSLPVGGSLTFSIGRVVNAAGLGSVIDLYAGAVTGYGASYDFDTDSRSIVVVGEGEALTATSASAQAGEDAVITVTALDADSNPVPGVEIDVLDDGGLQVSSEDPVTNSAGEAEFVATTIVADVYEVIFGADELDPTTAEVTFSAAAPAAMAASVVVDEVIANGSDEALFEVQVEDAFQNPVSNVWVTVSDDGGLADLTGAVELTADGVATFAATSTSAGAYEVIFSVDEAGSDDARVTFVAGDPAGFTFIQQPTDTYLEDHISPPVVVRVVDANGNWVMNDNETQIEILLRQHTATITMLDNRFVSGGEVTFSELNMDPDKNVEPGIDYYLRAMDASRTLSNADSTLFEVMEKP